MKKYNKILTRQKGEPRIDKYEKYLGGKENKWNSWDLQDKKIIFTGQDGRTLGLDLTIGKEYTIIDVKDSPTSTRVPGQYEKEFEFPGCFQECGRKVIIINDKGKKKKYYENLFKLSENQPEKKPFEKKNANDIFKVGDLIIPKKNWEWGSGIFPRRFHRRGPHRILEISGDSLVLECGARVSVNPYRMEFLKSRRKLAGDKLI